MAAPDELYKMKLITELSNQAVHEYEGLQRQHERDTMECQRMQAERDEAVKRLEEFQKVSHMVIEEVNSIQENLDIERTCRQSVEALASKLNRQNRSLKRKSMLYLAHLGPETIAEISLKDEEEEEEEESGDTQVEKECSSAHCQSTITELKNKLELTLEEKKQAAIDHEATREELRDIREELLTEKHDNMVLIAETVRQKKLLAKYNRVSLFAVEEYEALQENLDLERDLRAEAEKFAREMLVEQKKLNRQSQIVLKSSSPSEALQAALSDVTRLTQVLETQRLEHQQQMKVIEEQLRGSELQKEVVALQRKLELLAEERREHEERCSKAKVEAKDLKFTVEELQKKLQALSNPLPAPAPPPPPPPPPPPAPLTNPLSSLLLMIRKKKDISRDIPLVVQDSAKEPEMDIRQQAVDEMMQRIKRGVHLRPVGQAPNKTKPVQRERVPSNSAIQELKGILDTFKRPSPHLKVGSPSTNTESELERVLQRRRSAFQTSQESCSPSSPRPFPSSVLDVTRVRGDQPQTKQSSQESQDSVPL
ncbi:shootin-1 isoform X1 [Coregonus clupeaformis]|uniref:shootin-1 isoform X1 n=1 Tax=Coregonus clupeaformis TaxID=59861 RepID=UPI001BE11DDA|nr:shootin-1 isoform X1 [Coregonus clupeaformis]